jgi:hypothetical protein
MARVETAASRSAFFFVEAVIERRGAGGAPRPGGCSAKRAVEVNDRRRHRSRRAFMRVALASRLRFRSALFSRSESQGSSSWKVGSLWRGRVDACCLHPVRRVQGGGVDAVPELRVRSVRKGTRGRGTRALPHRHRDADQLRLASDAIREGRPPDVEPAFVAQLVERADLAPAVPALFRGCGVGLIAVLLVLVAWVLVSLR